MIVCQCWGVTDRDVRSLAKNGATSTRDIVRACSAGGDCGGCRAVIKAILQEEKRPRAQERSQTLVTA